MAKTKNNSKDEKQNSLVDFAGNVQGWGLGGNPFAPQNSRLDTVFLNTRWNLVSNYRSVLAEAYAEYGLVQTLVEQPVDDAFRSGFKIVTNELEDSQKIELQRFVEENRIIEELKKSVVWARLFGGGGLVIMVEQNPAKQFDISKVKKGSPLEFKAADMWELYKDQTNFWNPWEVQDEKKMYNYYGVRLHRSRVLPVCGKEAPSFIRPRLRGWGMSELERVIRSINAYLKNQDLIFELLDEAKIDVYQLNGFNTAMLTDKGTRVAERRVQVSNSLKSYLNALILDTNDKYEQKQLSFAGLSDILTQIRQGVASDLKMPMTKLFGVSAAGFNSGEDDIENYNSMIESEVRSKVKYLVVDVLKICCQYLFGFVPEDMSIKFNTLRILSAEQEENMKNSQFNRLIQAYSNGLVSVGDFMVGCNNEALLPFTYAEEDIQAMSQSGYSKIGMEKSDKKGKKGGLFSKFFGGATEPGEDPNAVQGNGMNFPNKAKKGNEANEQGKVKEVDVTSNKFTTPDREKKPLPEESFPYKGHRTKRYVEAGH
ncbi:MAG: DUF1073 domain-containing protein [Bacteroidales bacterium]|nr:DUF1073 domain-containing protein [Candidatus Scybalousia scybalohippi]